MTDTPETDAATVGPECDDSCCAIYVRDRAGFEVYGDLVPADFARKLERQRNELLEALEWMVKRYAGQLDNIGEYGQIIEQARAAIAKVKWGQP